MTENLLVSAPGTYDAYGEHGAGGKKNLVDPPDNDATNYIYSALLNDTQSFTLEPSAIPPGSTINSVSVSSRSRWYDNPVTYRTLLRLAGTDQLAAQITLTNSWVTYLDTIPRPGGGPWSLADLATLEIGVTCDTGGDTHVCTTLFAIIDYTPPAPPSPSGDMLLVF